MNESLYHSFYITYAFLVTTGTITFIESLRTNIVPMRHILNLETCISIVAAFFYGKFIEKLNNKSINKESLQNEINDNRYVDWMITTPIMLLVLMLAFKYNSGIKNYGIKFIDFCLVLLLNYGMLGSGYLGEKGVIEKPQANMIGFVFFAGLYGFLYQKFLKKDKKNTMNKLLFMCFLILWALYGVFYLMNENTKNAGYNVLDLFSKCFVGIYFWSYSSKIFI